MYVAEIYCIGIKADNPADKNKPSQNERLGPGWRARSSAKMNRMMKETKNGDRKRERKREREI
jgi:hypothetical protein